MELEGAVAACDFVFRAKDDDGVLARFEALFTYADDASGRSYIVYTDVDAQDDGEVGTYASVLLDPVQAEAAQAQVDAGSRPKKPPVLELAVIEDEAEWDLVYRVLDAVEAEED